MKKIVMLLFLVLFAFLLFHSSEFDNTNYKKNDIKNSDLNLVGALESSLLKKRDFAYPNEVDEKEMRVELTQLNTGGGDELYGKNAIKKEKSESLKNNKQPRFISLDSKLHEELSDIYLEEQGVFERNGLVYFPYETELGVEFYEISLDALKHSKNNYYDRYDKLTNDLNTEKTWGSDNSEQIYSLLGNFNSDKFLLTFLDCRSKYCLGQIALIDQNYEAIMEFSDFVRSKRRSCQCKMMWTLSDGFIEGVVEFYFD